MFHTEPHTELRSRGLKNYRSTFISRPRTNLVATQRSFAEFNECTSGWTASDFSGDSGLSEAEDPEDRGKVSSKFPPTSPQKPKAHVCKTSGNLGNSEKRWLGSSSMLRYPEREFLWSVLAVSSSTIHCLRVWL